MRLFLAGLLAATSAAIAPASAWADGAFSATDFAWTAAGGGTSVTIASGERVSFGYPSGMSMHNAEFLGLQPASCEPPLPGPPTAAGWSATCTFTVPGQYAFVCGLHSTMTGRVVVLDPGGGPPPPPPPPPPGEPPPPPPPPTVASGPAASAVRLARVQRGTTVRGSLLVSRPGSRLDVQARVRGVRVGTSTRRALAVGRVRFAVTLQPAARRKLMRDGSLKLSVRIVVTPANGARFVATRLVTMRRMPA